MCDRFYKKSMVSMYEIHKKTDSHHVKTFINVHLDGKKDIWPCAQNVIF